MKRTTSLLVLFILFLTMTAITAMAAETTAATTESDIFLNKAVSRLRRPVLPLSPRQFFPVSSTDLRGTSRGGPG